MKRTPPTWRQRNDEQPRKGNQEEDGSSQANGIERGQVKFNEISRQQEDPHHECYSQDRGRGGTAKNVFQIYTRDMETGEVISKQLKRAQFLQWFANRAPCLIGMEACGSSHHWARQLQSQGHEIKLMLGKMVKACQMLAEPLDVNGDLKLIQIPSCQRFKTDTPPSLNIRRVQRISATSFPRITPACR